MSAVDRLNGFFVVFDLDGTLSDDSHRRHLIEGPFGEKSWMDYYKRCVDDPPIVPVCKLFRRLCERSWTNQPTKVEIWTGRSEEVREETCVWLHQHELWPERLLMRPREHFGTHAELKGVWLDGAERKPDLVIDDNLKAVEWWREQGVFALAAGTASF